jgi:hypothetical protein
MTIIVLMGGTHFHQEEIIKDFGAARPGRIERFSVSGLVDPAKRVERYKFIFSRKTFDDRVTVVVGVTDPDEVATLRQLGAVFCHVRGPLAKVFCSVPMLMSDLHVFAHSWRGCKPDVVLTPAEVLSECLIRFRKKVG